MTPENIQAMPWTNKLMTVAQFEEWATSRKEAGENINIETCEIDCWYAFDFDPYGIQNRKGELSEEGGVGWNLFVRSSESHGWVSEIDLPREKVKAMYDRIERQAQRRRRETEASHEA
jgi:hypothetical protein